MISASDVKILRERSGAGMMDCKKALTEANGDLEKASEILREKGLAAAVKKSGRIAAEGLVQAYVADGGKSAALVEINCETDFVAKTPDFVDFTSKVAQALNAAEDVTEDTFVEMPFEGSTLKEAVIDKVATIGENINVRRFAKYNVTGSGLVECYIHMGGKIGVMLEITCGKPESTEAKTLARDIAMHIAATNPMYVSEAEVDPSVLDKEREILTAQALNEGKPENVVAKMVEGRIKKFKKEICLLDQPFVKDPDRSVAQLLADSSASVGGDAAIVGFVRYEMGEGLQKREDDFAAEVAAQTGI